MKPNFERYVEPQRKVAGEFLYKESEEERLRTWS